MGSQQHHQRLQTLTPEEVCQQGASPAQSSLPLLLCVPLPTACAALVAWTQVSGCRPCRHRCQHQHHPAAEPAHCCCVACCCYRHRCSRGAACWSLQEGCCRPATSHEAQGCCCCCCCHGSRRRHCCHHTAASGLEDCCHTRCGCFCCCHHRCHCCCAWCAGKHCRYLLLPKRHPRQQHPETHQHWHLGPLHLSGLLCCCRVRCSRLWCHWRAHHPPAAAVCCCCLGGTAACGSGPTCCYCCCHLVEWS